MEDIVKEFIGDYLPPCEEYYSSCHEEFHDLIEKGLLFSNDIDLIEDYLIRFPWLINNQSNYFNNSTLYIACEYDLEDVVYLLLSYGANISLKNIFGWTAYDIADYQSSLNCINLLEKKASLIIEEKWIDYYINKKISEDFILDIENKLSLN